MRGALPYMGQRFLWLSYGIIATNSTRSTFYRLHHKAAIDWNEIVF